MRFIKQLYKQLLSSEIVRRYYRFRSSIYGRVVFIIGGSLLALYLLFNLIFRSVYDDFINSSIRENAENIGSIVEGSLYYSMLENDKAMLQRTLYIIGTMSGIEEVNMYNDQDSLAFTSLSAEKENFGNQDCKSCHQNFSDMFSATEKAYRIVGGMANCGIAQGDHDRRFLLIRKPILNEKSCFTAACHAHTEEDKVLGSLIIKMPLDKIDNFERKSSANFLSLVTIITGLLMLFLIGFAWRKIKNPLYAIIHASEAVSKGDNSIRLKIKPDLLDDLKMVSLAFNNMLDNIESATFELQNWSQQLEYKVQKKSEELLEAQNELIHVERIASLGKLSSSVAHEINNPLSGILVYTKLIYKQLNDEEFKHKKKEAILKHLKLIEGETKRCGDIVKGLLDFSRKDQDDFEVAKAHELLKATYSLMTHAIKMADINLRLDFMAEDDHIFCSPNQIKQACVALLVNASEAIQNQGEITVKTSNPDNDTFRLDISDNGCGISKENLPHIFEPFFSTKRDQSGIGLGLAIVHGIVENHKGKIAIDSEIGKGTTFSIILPLSKS